MEKKSVMNLGWDMSYACIQRWQGNGISRAYSSISKLTRQYFRIMNRVFMGRAQLKMTHVNMTHLDFVIIPDLLWPSLNGSVCTSRAACSMNYGDGIDS